MDLLQEFKFESNRFDSNLAIVSAKAMKEIWTSGPVFNVDPFDYERNGFKKGTILKKSPSNTNKKLCYFLTGSEHIVMIKTGIEIPEHYYTEFFFYNNPFLKSVLYGTDREMINIKIREVEDGRITKLFMKATLGSREEKYYYDDRKLVSINVKQWEGEVEKTGFNALFIYNGDELDEVVNVYSNGYRDMKYKRK